MIYFLVLCRLYACVFYDAYVLCFPGKFGTRAFSVTGPTIWSLLLDSLRDPSVEYGRLRRDSKTHIIAGH